MNIKGAELRIKKNNKGAAYFSSDDVFGYLSGIEDAEKGKKRILYETADELGLNSVGDALSKLLKDLGMSEHITKNSSTLAEMYGIHNFDDAFKKVILRFYETGKPIIKLMVSRAKQRGEDGSIISNSGEGQ